MKLGVNVDHVATLRQARKSVYPQPLVAALLACQAGCDSIVIHVREDRRHAQEEDAVLIKKQVSVPLNLEMSIYPDIVDFALRLRPYQATLVPERRQELTTEGGLDLVAGYRKIANVIKKLKDLGIQVSVFIDPEVSQIAMAKKIGADLIEINTGRYSEAKSGPAVIREISKVRVAAELARKIGFFVAAGHGLDYENVKRVANIADIGELNIGHSIVSRSIMVGFKQAVAEMRGLIRKASGKK